MTKILVCCALGLACGSTKASSVDADIWCDQNVVRQVSPDAGSSTDAASSTKADGGTVCSFELPHLPVGDEMLAIGVRTSAGLLEIPPDPANGWSFAADMNFIVFNGSACAGLMDGTYSEITFVYACGGPIGKSLDARRFRAAPNANGATARQSRAPARAGVRRG